MSYDESPIQAAEEPIIEPITVEPLVAEVAAEVADTPIVTAADDAAYALPARLAHEEDTIAAHAELNLVAERPIEDYETARAALGSRDEVAEENVAEGE